METFYRDTWVEVNLDNIYENIQNLRNYLQENVEIIAVVKANAYGHGAVAVAHTAVAAGATMLAVALLDEAVALRNAGITAPIVVMGWIRPEDIIVAKRYDVIATVFQLEWLQKAVNLLAEDDILNIHVKFDTGMGRLGIKTKREADQILTYIKNEKRLHLHGVYTHFATADEIENNYFEYQYETFLEMLQWVKEKGLRPSVIHCSNSAATLNYPDKVWNAVRYGISMYGLSPSVKMKEHLPFPLQEAFSLHSKIVHVKEMLRGERISYGGVYEAAEDGEIIGTIPIGYADGWIRKLKDAEVLVNGKRCPIVGRICMDQLMVRLPERVPIGTKVTLIGAQGDEKISVDEVAAIVDTINYEIPCMISYRVPRIFLRKKRIIDVKRFFRND